MPTLQENKAFWGSSYPWAKGGDEWSKGWGGPRPQWFGTILPRIQAFVPTNVILEIACGHGRWTQFLKGLCTRMIAVDISEECIRVCKDRFARDTNVAFHLTDGKSLDMVLDHSVDFVFSVDSLVHADETVLRAYLEQLSRILTKDGVAFLHHSNLGQYSPLLKTTQKIRVTTILMRLGILERNYHWRDMTVSAKKVERLAEDFELQCVSQELITWGTKKALIDCFSTITRKGSSSARENRVLRNPFFGFEIQRISQLYNFYQRVD
jgi:ubiquinone/menaquinone biosynthesis C-methylase UbiE